jgi:hypothetical protein
MEAPFFLSDLIWGFLIKISLTKAYVAFQKTLGK